MWVKPPACAAAMRSASGLVRTFAAQSTRRAGGARGGHRRPPSGEGRGGAGDRAASGEVEGHGVSIQARWPMRAVKARIASAISAGFSSAQRWPQAGIVTR